MQTLARMTLAASAMLFSSSLGATAAPTPDGAALTSISDGPVDLSAAPSGHYQADPHHHQLLFFYQHQGFSHPWVRWRDWTADLDWNAEKPEASSVAVTINVSGVDSGVDVFDGHLKSDKFFDAAKHPAITFKSTSLKRTGPNSGTMTGDLTIKGVTKPATLDVVINKGGEVGQDGGYKLGFSARGTVKRSDYGLDAYVPFVGDEVSIVIEAEFLSAKESQ